MTRNHTKAGSFIPLLGCKFQTHDLIRQNCVSDNPWKASSVDQTQDILVSSLSQASYH